MELDRIVESAEIANSYLDLQEFCDMEQLYRLIDNWSRSSGMSAVIVDTEGNRTSESFGMTEFCRMIHANENGRISCANTWKAEHDGIYVCPVGFCDFSVPIVLPNGQILGKVLAGQALSVNQKNEEILKKTSEYGIDTNAIKDALFRVHKKPILKCRAHAIC